MTDVLIRDVPDDVVSAIEAKAKRLGLSRTEYLRRQMARVASTPETSSGRVCDGHHRCATAVAARCGNGAQQWSRRGQVVGCPPPLA